MRVALISDIHLSRARPYFHFNWEILLECLAEEGPDLVLVSGDLSLDGPHHPDDLAFARTQLDRLPAPWRAVPGNHDVGNNIPDLRGEAVITEARIAEYRAVFGLDHWLHDVPGWRIIGLNSLLCGSGFAAEADQAAFLADAIASAPAQIALIFHKPFCEEDPADAAISQSYWYPATRSLLTPHMARVQLMLAGHLHESRDFMIDGVRHLWVPGVAFVADMAETINAVRGCRRRVGYTMLSLADTVTADIKEPPAMMNIDIGTWLKDGIGHYAVFAGQRPYLGLSTPH